MTDTFKANMFVQLTIDGKTSCHHQFQSIKPPCPWAAHLGAGTCFTQRKQIIFFSAQLNELLSQIEPIAVLCDHICQIRFCFLARRLGFV